MTIRFGGALLQAPRGRHRRSLRRLAKRTEDEWRQVLTQEQFYVLREEGTERARTSPLNDVDEPGTFVCAGCGAPLFTTTTKFESGTGWPSFSAPVDGRAVELRTDFKLVLPRTEVRCRACEGHLGHVFDDGPRPTGERYCMNGVAMNFRSDEANEELAREVRARGAESIRRPLATVLPSALFNSALAGAFLVSFSTRHSHAAPDTLPAQIFAFLPLAAGIFYGSQALTALAKLVPQDD